MASSYDNDLRLNEMATGDGSGTWGTTTNVNLNLIAEAFSYGTEAITTNADTHTTTIADGSTDPGRSMYLKYTGTLDSACTITIAPNDISKVWIIENGTSGSQNIIISQGSGADITIPAGDTKVVYSDGAGAGAAFFDAFASLSVVDLKVQDDLTVTDAALVTGVLTTTATQVATGGITSGSDIISDTDSTDSLGSTGVRWLKGWFDTLTAGTLTVGSGSVTDSSGAISFGNENLTTTGIVTAAGTSVFTNLDISGDIDVDGTTNLDVVDVDGAVNFAADVTFADGADIITASAGTSNFRAGVNAGNSIESGGNYNTVVGDEAGTAITTGDYTTAVGYSAGTAVTTGLYNTVVGAVALDATTTGAANVALGVSSLGANTTGNNNTALGTDALVNNTTASNNTAVGKSALGANTTGESNTAVGAIALDACTTGTQNVAVGYNALSTSVAGNYQTAVGYQALANANYTANVVAYNTAFGWNAGLANTIGKVTAVGAAALTSNTTGINNAAFGGATDAQGAALEANTTGSNNTAFGYAALRSNTTAGDNTAFGASALSVGTTAAFNTGLGRQALELATTGSNNTAVGYYALRENTTGSSNVAVGKNAGDLITTGASNVCIGISAGQNVTTGAGNVMIGNTPQPSTGAASGQICIGVNPTCVGDNNFTFGYQTTDSNIAFGATVITAPSDIRLKEDIQDEEIGLDFIKDLRPVTFLWKKEKDCPPDMKVYKEGSEERVMNGKYNHGFIAQEVKATIDAHGFKEGFDMWQEDELDGRQRVAPSAIMSVMVKAVQELSTQVDELKSELLALKGE
jgi:hypothetical protein